MKTCKYGCGGKMKESGKVATIKKMKTGGTSGCPPNQCKEWNIDKTSYSCKPCKSVQVARAAIAAISTAVQNAFTSKAGKNREANAAAKKAAEEAANTPVAKFTKKLDETLKTKKMGGATKGKYAMGGNTGGYAPAQKGGDNTKNGIYGIPNAGRTDSLGFKKGGSTTSRAVKPGCRGGMVKDASGNCVAERMFKAGGTVNKKFAALAPPYNKATFADRIAGAKKKVVKKKK